MAPCTLDVVATPAPVAALDRLGDEIAELSAQLDAATARLLDLIRVSGQSVASVRGTSTTGSCGVIDSQPSPIIHRPGSTIG